MPGINPEPGAIEGLGLTPNQVLSKTANMPTMPARRVVWADLIAPAVTTPYIQSHGTYASLMWPEHAALYRLSPVATPAR